MLFIPNKYTRIYYSICSRARKENRKKTVPGEYEAHHFLPKAIFPQFKDYNKYKWNKVLLTPKEHYICHLLLTKMFEGTNRSKMCMPLHRMAIKSGRAYDLARKLVAQASSDLQKGRPKSPQAIENMAATKRGKPSPKKGIKLTEEQKLRYRGIKKSVPVWNKGIKQADYKYMKQMEKLNGI